MIATASAWPRIATMTSWILADSHVEASTKWRLIAIVVLLAGVIVFGVSRRKPAARIVVTPVFSFS